MESLINEFHYISTKIVSSVEDMTLLERKQWINCLKYCESGILDQYTSIENVLNVNFFDPEFEEFNEYSFKLVIDQWRWKEKDLIIIMANEHDRDIFVGGIFIGERMVCHFDQTFLNLGPTDEGQEFKDKIQEDALLHILKTVIDGDEDYDECIHSHCEVQRAKREKI